MTLKDKTIKQLLEIYNEKAEKPLKQWKQSRTKLIIRIEALTPKKIKEAKKRVGTLQSRAEELLLTRVSENGKKIGMSYKEILDVLQEEFPKAVPTLNSLRWYASKLNCKKDISMPERPRG